ncbi:MAG: bifunctional folylpolyglutamate synthase/dihydrofolate synthase [Candidatus Gastranaerophilales bacterium]|nr:bifunctional folylpolyglutamate synthase/dihydrofolate synthase [Candidatus Gastranaerophilales bacterium]
MSLINKNKSKYQQAIDILTSQGKFYINLGLERIKQVLDLIGNPQEKLMFIHVAGTNGKGSVCAILSSILAKSKKQKRRRQEDKKTRCVEEQDENHASTHLHIHASDNLSAFQPFSFSAPSRFSPLTSHSDIPSRFTLHASPLNTVGLFISPHIFEYTERIKINNIEIDKETFAKKIIEITELAQKNNIHLTEFEILTAVALQYFAENDVNLVILETGLGGRLDATNVIGENICSVFTHIDFDHTERLGDTIDKIAFEKAGIIKENCPVIISSENLGFKIVKKVAKEKNSPVLIADDAANFPSENSPLKSTYQSKNLALVLKAIDLLREKGFEISQEAIKKGLENVKHPCRFEYIREKNILIDGAHNPNGANALRESLDYYFPDQKFQFIFGCLNNKDYIQMIKNLFTPKDMIYFYHFDNPNACTYEELADACEFKSKPFSEFKQDNNTLTVICGSFYMIKELLLKIDLK